MTQVSEIIYRAYRELVLLDENTHLTRNQVRDGLTRYSSLVNGFYGYEAGEQLVDWPIGDYGRESQSKQTIDEQNLIRPPINSRLVHTAESAKTIYLDPEPSDGAMMGITDPHSLLSTYNITLDANGRTIENVATLALSTDALERTWFYRADLGDWVRLATLTASDTVPFPEEFDTMFVVYLAVRLAPAQADNIPDATMAVAERLRKQFMNRYLQARDLEINPDIEFYRMTNQRRGAYTARDFFDRGYGP